MGEMRYISDDSILCIEAYWVWEEAIAWPTVCVLPFLSILHILQFYHIFASQLIVFLTVIANEVLYGYLLQPVNILIWLVAVVTPIAHIGVREVFKSIVVFT
tara:strand:+ start:608 stop:913 length:306 start_codon:yes stop_codon:yes gene_type:complete